jgi:hypothetical protein
MGQPPLTIALDLGLANYSDRVTGTLSGGGLAVNLSAERNSFDSRLNPAPQAGLYTFLLPRDPAKTSAPFPQGNGFGAATVDASGLVRASGVLGDGKPFASAAWLSKNGAWPFFAAPYPGSALVGTLAFRGAGNANDVDGPLTWVKSSAFTLGINVAGSRVAPPVTPDGRGTVVIGASGVGSVPVTIDGGQLTSGLPGFGIAIKPGGGFFLGKFIDPTAARALPIRGVFLQKQESGGGFFRSAGGTGFVDVSMAH